MSLMRRTARRLVARTTRTSRPTTAPILTPIGRFANQPPDPRGRELAGTDMWCSWGRGNGGTRGFEIAVSSVGAGVARVKNGAAGNVGADNETRVGPIA